MAIHEIPVPLELDVNEDLYGKTLYLVFDFPRIGGERFLSKLPPGVEDVTHLGGPGGIDLEANVVRLAISTKDVMEQAAQAAGQTPGTKVGLFQFLTDHEYRSLIRMVVVPEDGSAPATLDHPGEQCAGNPEEWGREVLAGISPETLILTAEEYMQEVESHLADDPDLEAARTFFYRLDKASHEHLLNAQESAGTLVPFELSMRRYALAEVMIEISARLKRRKKGDVELGPVPEVRRPHLERLSSLQLELYREVFGVDPEDGTDLDNGIQIAIEQFSSGRLRKRLPSKAWTCQPSSGFYFYFGEFALLAVDSDVDREAWLRLGRAYVRSQETFALTYPPSGSAAKDLAGYHACNYRVSRGGAKQQVIDNLRVQYDGLAAGELAQKATENVIGRLKDL